jgi:hypothetical protein
MTESSALNPYTQLIQKKCGEICIMLLEKNTAYGNSIFEPLKVFSKSDTLEQIRVRIDDKLSRLMRGKKYKNEDTVLDLVGYLVLYLVQEEYEKSKKSVNVRTLDNYAENL